jgi:hypothetical protein
VTISTTPTYPRAGESVTLASSDAGDGIVVWALTGVPVSSALELGFQRLSKGLRIDAPTDDPAGKKLAEQLSDPPRSAVEVARRGVHRADFTPDVPGPYTFAAFFVRRRPGIPAFLGDSAGDERFDLVDSDSATIHVGGIVDLPIVTTAEDGAILRLQVNNTTVATAGLVEPRNEKSRVAAEAATVVAAIAALAGQSIGSAGPNVETAVTELRTKYEAHRISSGGGGAHGSPDTVDGVPRTAADSVAGAITLGAALYDALVAHLTSGSNVASPWHADVIGVPHDDLKNLPIAPKPSTLAQLTVAQADLRYRVFERHRVQVANPAAHVNADNANAVASATLLDTLIVAYLDALAIENPTAPAGEAEGIGDAEHLYGFGANLVAGGIGAGPGGTVVVVNPAPPPLATDGLYACDARIAVGECVRISAADTVDEADATSSATMPAYGIVIGKPDATHAVVRPLGEISGVLTGLTPGATYYVDKIAGAITTTTAGFGPGNVEQKIGFAKDSATFVAQFDGDTTTL